MEFGPFSIIGERKRSDTVELDQDYEVDSDGNVVVYDETHSNELFDIEFQCDEDTAWNIKKFLLNGMRMRMRTFSITDDFGTTYLVRYWNNSFKKDFVAPDLWKIRVTLRREN